MSTASDWRPAAPLEHLRARAALLAAVRDFFARRGVLEVETPALSSAAATDLHLQSFVTDFHGPGPRRLYLHTSPEFPMKRLLAAGSGPIYQICKVYRDGEAGHLHNPEFTLLEWYRPGFSYIELMAEVEALVASIIGTVEPAEHLTYAEAFARYTQLEPHTADLDALRAAAQHLGIDIRALAGLERDAWLDLILTHAIEPRLGRGGRPTLLRDYPATQAALARVRPGAPPVAERFELYIDGTEIANGFQELMDADEQRRRFEADLSRRRAQNLLPVPYDPHLLAALAHGLPSCAGVAVGLDRLLMVKLGVRSIAAVLAFPFDRA